MAAATAVPAWSGRWEATVYGAASPQTERLEKLPSRPNVWRGLHEETEQLGDQ